MLSLLICMLLCSCSRAVRSPADELCMYSWSSVCDNGNRLSLSFDEDTAVFKAENDSYNVIVSGIYLLDDERLIISDVDTMMNYVFAYIVHGDCVELSFGDGTVTLDKVIDK